MFEVFHFPSHCPFLRFFFPLFSCVCTGLRTEKFFVQDQNFHRAMWNKSNPRLSPCLIPHGKYVITSRWSLMTSKENTAKGPKGFSVHLRSFLGADVTARSRF